MLRDCRPLFRDRVCRAHSHVRIGKEQNARVRPDLKLEELILSAHRLFAALIETHFLDRRGWRMGRPVRFGRTTGRGKSSALGGYIPCHSVS
jgi:DNA-binding transcriptional LysR family regulator